MDSRFKAFSDTNSSNGVTKRKYFDKQFKKHLVKALILNHGEPDNIEKVRGNRFLAKYPEQKIIEYVNAVSADVQKHVESTTEDPDLKEVFLLSNLTKEICDNRKPQELPLMLKLKVESDIVAPSIKTNGVDFKALNQFLYSAVSGLPDYVDLNKESLKVLSDTYRMLTEQVQHDATPEFLSELKSKICAGYTEQPHKDVKNLAMMFQDKGLNPFNFPFEYLLNGTLPEETSTKKNVDTIEESNSVDKKLQNDIVATFKTSSSSKKPQAEKKAAKIEVDNDEN